MAILRRGKAAKQPQTGERTSATSGETGERTAPTKPGDSAAAQKFGQPTADPQPVATAPTIPQPPVSERTAARTGEGTVVERLDGIRGWLGDLDRTVGVRSRIGLVLIAIAIGAAGAAIYLALNAKHQSASNRDVSALRDQLRSAQKGANRAARDVTALRSSVNAARSQASAANATASNVQSEIQRLRKAQAAAAAATPAVPTGPTGATGAGTTTTPATGGATGGGGKKSP